MRILALFLLLQLFTCGGVPIPTPPPTPVYPTILTVTIPKATVSYPYSFQLQAINCTYSCNWTITGLPAGLVGTSTGLIAGKPLTAGSFTFQASVQ